MQSEREWGIDDRKQYPHLLDPVQWSVRLSELSIILTTGED